MRGDGPLLPPTADEIILPAVPRTTETRPVRPALAKLTATSVAKEPALGRSGARTAGRAATTLTEKAGVGFGRSTDRTPALHGLTHDAVGRPRRTSINKRNLKLELQMQSPV